MLLSPVYCSNTGLIITVYNKYTETCIYMEMYTGRITDDNMSRIRLYVKYIRRRTLTYSYVFSILLIIMRDGLWNNSSNLLINQ